MYAIIMMLIPGSGVARPVKMGGQAVGKGVFQVGKGLWSSNPNVNTFIKTRGVGRGHLLL